MKRISRRIKECFEAATPNVLPSVLADCVKLKEDVVPISSRKNMPLVLRLIASAAILALLVGVGSLAGGLFTRPSVQSPATSDPQLIYDYPKDAEILAAFCNATNYAYKDIADTATVRHYWHLGDLYFFYVDGLKEYPTAMTSYQFEGKEFLFASDQHLYLYQNGVCADFMIWEQSHKLLTTAVVDAFHIFHKSEQSVLYIRDNWPQKSALDCPAHLTPEKRSQLEAALGWDQYDTDSMWYSKDKGHGVRYYGTYEGYDILFHATELQAETTITIANQAFTHGTSFVLYAHKDGQMLQLSNAYTKGFITKASVAEAMAYHNQCIHPLMVTTCRPYAITRNQEQYIEEAWKLISTDPFGTWYSEDQPDGDWRYYGDQIYFYDGGEQEEVFTTVKIGDYTFSHPTTFKLYYYRYGTSALIDLTVENPREFYDYELAEAFELHMQTQNALLGENWQSGCNHRFENTVLREPTCSDPGEGVDICRDCGYTVACEYALKEHIYEHWVQEYATCQKVGINKVTCRVCGDSYLEETPKTDHDWDNKHSCSFLVHCKNCDAIRDPIHVAVGGASYYSDPTADKAGTHVKYCQFCRQSFREIWGHTGDYMLLTIQYKASKYAESLGFEYREGFPTVPDIEYEYTETYRVIESLGGQDALLAKAYELIDKLYEDASTIPVSPSACKLWFTIEYLTDSDDTVGVFRIHTFIAY